MTMFDLIIPRFLQNHHHHHHDYHPSHHDHDHDDPCHQEDAESEVDQETCTPIGAIAGIAVQLSTVQYWYTVQASLLV